MGKKYKAIKLTQENAVNTCAPYNIDEVWAKDIVGLTLVCTPGEPSGARVQACVTDATLNKLYRPTGEPLGKMDPVPGGWYEVESLI